MADNSRRNAGPNEILHAQRILSLHKIAQKAGPGIPSRLVNIYVDAQASAA